MQYAVFSNEYVAFNDEYVFFIAEYVDPLLSIENFGLRKQ